jgi:FKBP-type peptidyl-prolyl cis-trans isomerase
MRTLFLLLLLIGLSSCQKDEMQQHEADIMAIEAYLEQRGIAAERDPASDFFYYFYVDNDHPYQVKRDKNLTVEVRYKASLLDGTVVADTGNDAELVVLEESLYGWQLALPLMSTGDHMLLVLPSRLAYGDEISSLIPEDANLVFEIELLEIYPKF